MLIASALLLVPAGTLPGGSVLGDGRRGSHLAVLVRLGGANEHALPCASRQRAGRALARAGRARTCCQFCRLGMILNALGSLPDL